METLTWICCSSVADWQTSIIRLNGVC